MSELIYNKTNWKDDETTPINARNLNNLEDGIEYIYHKWDDIISDATTGDHAAELIDARNGIGGTNKTLGQRLNKIDEQFNTIQREITDVAEKGTTVEVVTNTTKTVIDEKIANGTMANLTIGTGSITQNKFDNNTLETLDKTKYLQKINEGFEADGIIAKTNTYDMINTRNGTLYMSGVTNWAVPFRYNGSNYSELYIPYLKVSTDTVLTVVVADKGKFNSPIIKREYNIISGVYNDLYLDFSINKSLLNTGTIYWIYFSVKQGTTFEISKSATRTENTSYLIPFDNSTYPALYGSSWGVAVAGYDLCVGFVKESNYVYNSVKSVILENINGVQDYKNFKNDVFKYRRNQDALKEQQQLCDLTSNFDSLSYNIQSYAINLDKSKVTNFNTISCRFKSRDTANNVRIKVFVLDGTGCDLKYMIASGYSDYIDVVANEIIDVEVILKDRFGKIIDIDITNIQNNLYVGYMILDENNGSTVRFACNYATDLNNFMLGSHYSYLGINDSTTAGFLNHVKNPFPGINISYSTMLDTYTTTCEIATYFPNIPSTKITGLPGSKLLSTYLPSQIPVIEGETYELFLDSIIACKNHKVYNIGYEGTLNGFKSNDRKLYLESAKIGNGGVFTLKFKDDYDNLIATQSSEIKIYPKFSPSTNKNVLIIGDSVTEQANIPRIIKTKLVADGITNISFIGTKGDGHEGRSGWKIDDYLRKYYNNDNINLNPFWNDAKSDVDFLNYCSVNGYSGIDYCIIHLNWNNRMTPTTLAEKYKLLVDKILRDYPNCRIFTVGFDGYASNRVVSSSDITKEKVFEYTIEREKLFESYTNVNTIHLLHEIDNEYAHNWTSISVNTRKTDVKEGILGDYIHSSTVGYSQTADCYYRTLISDMYNNQ